MKRFTLLTFTLLLGTGQLFSQKFITREGYIKFFGETALETIDPVSNQGASVVDIENKEFAFQVLLKSFRFTKALMEEHFNENYVESDKYPKAVFKGKFTEDIDLSKAGETTINVKGTMSMHGVDHPVSTPCKITVHNDGTFSLESNFQMSPEEYNIKIPSAVRDKIAKTFDVTVKAKYTPVK
jgi:polyisoprenoid-binding protein YceI